MRRQLDMLDRAASMPARGIVECLCLIAETKGMTYSLIPDRPHSESRKMPDLDEPNVLADTDPPLHANEAVPPHANEAVPPHRDERADQAWLARQTLPKLPLMMARGCMGRCPVCGSGRLYAGYLRVVETCASCAAPLGAVRADDAPPYFTIFITAHLIIALVVVTGQRTDLPVWSMIAFFLPLTVVIAMLLLRPIKGATVGAMLKLGLIGEHRDETG
jgi:uncharacterized protein (DUF983 family)